MYSVSFSNKVYYYYEFRVLVSLIRAIRSLYDQCQSLVRIAGSKLDSFLMQVGLRLSCHLSPIHFITFIYMFLAIRIWFDRVRIGSLLSADNVVLFASASHDLQLSLE